VTSSARSAIDVLCVGLATYDLVMTVDRHPGPDEKCFASGFTACGGGPAANAAVTVARLSGTSAFAGYLGNDPHGDRHFREFAEEGIDTRWVVRGSQPTPLSVILVKPNGDRTVVSHKAKMPDLMPKDLDMSSFLPKSMLFDGHQPTLSLELAKTAKSRKIPIILDAGSVHEGTLKLLPLTDYLVTSCRFAQDFTGGLNGQEALRALSIHSPFVVITCGENGLVWKNGADEGAMPCFPVKAIDTTGAGDTFHGAFALALAEGREPLEALRYASAAAALCCTRIGARAGIPTGKEVTAFAVARGLQFQHRRVK